MHLSYCGACRRTTEEMKRRERENWECVSGINVQCLFMHNPNFVNSFLLLILHSFLPNDADSIGAWEIKKSTLDPSCPSLSLSRCRYFSVMLFFSSFRMCCVSLSARASMEDDRSRQAKGKPKRCSSFSSLFSSCGTLVNNKIIIISSNKLLFYYYCSLSFLLLLLFCQHWIKNHRKESQNKNTREESFLPFSLTHST